MSDEKSAEKRARRACRNLGYTLSRLRSSGHWAVLDSDGAVMTEAGTTLGEIAAWLSATGTQRRRDATLGHIHDRGRFTLHVGEALAVLRALPTTTFQTCVTSPPYFGARDYGHVDQIGQEETPDQYIARLVEVFAEVHRVLKPKGVLWVVIGDGYVSNPSTSHIPRSSQGNGNGVFRIPGEQHVQARRGRPNRATALIRDGLKMKDKVGIPWRLAFALRDAGWYLRSDIIWQKPSPMPQSVTDRPASSFEYVFLLTKVGNYAFNQHAIAELSQSSSIRNGRDVWTIPTSNYRSAHFATMPMELARRCILAGSNRGDRVLDPFAGAGTTRLAAIENGRDAAPVELNPEYANLIRRRLGY